MKCEKISPCYESIMILWPWQKTQFRQLMVLNWKHPSSTSADTFFFLLLPSWWKGTEVTEPTVRTLEARSLGSHHKRWKDKPWIHHLTSVRFSVPIIREMRTLAIHPTKGLKGTMRRSTGSPLNSSEVISYRSTKPLIKGHTHTFLRLQWVVHRQNMCRPDTECFFSLK